MSPILDSIGSVKAFGWSSLIASNTSFESIATTTLSSDTTITFNSISSAYTHLQLRIIGKTTRPTYQNDFVSLRFNSDSGNNYVSHEFHGDGSATEANSTLSFNKIYNGASIGSTAMNSSTFGGAVIDILDYANSNKFKVTRGLGGWDNNGAGWAGLCSGLWMSTSAITSITLLGGEGANLANGTTVALYGIKSA